jgi:hypothetical protein
MSSNYAGPATLVLADGSRAPGAANLSLDSAPPGRLQSWSGRFRADAPSADVFNAVGGNLPLELPNGQTGHVLVQSLDNVVSPTPTLRLLGNGAPPF